MEGIKIVTIGGGSSYTPELIEGFIKRYPELPVRELWLVDIPEGRKKLEVVSALAKRMVEKAGVPIEIHTTLDRREALPGADFVTTQIRVGHLEARAKDERIPLKYGVIGQETNGPGGLFKGLRTIPVILEICRDIEELCPEAWFINFSNPAGMVTEAVLRYSGITKTIGLCNVPIGMHMAVAEMLEVEQSRIHIDFAGLNHMVFGLEVYLDGKAVMGEVLDKLASGPSMTMKNIVDVGWEKDFIKALNLLPCPYHRYYYQTEKMLEQEQQALQDKGTRAEVVQDLEKELFTLYSDESLAVKPKQLEERGGAFYSDAACNLINSIYNNKQDIQVVNVRNNGAISSLPADSAVEVSCIITNEGPKPIAMGGMPVAVSGLVQQIKSFERLAAEAAVTGSYHTALLAMAINPLVSSDSTAKQILDEMLEAHKEYLPQFEKSYAG
ncbi:6-phospho-beta-glucosidase [Planococcus wigleyi]|uniref:6-phospho-beta-glucosidase n=1 Tax=Planococcus wigleyi TaxID=2762216 RepID=A0ABR8WC64_9BACL|nr:6-phospho-beta-glucosidase [Planococcus wigleyi]MBD8014577.1 6-phospho-beta-glucosidase [Planococcus wigleyi]